MGSRKWLIALCWILAAVLLLLIFATAYAHQLLGLIQRPDADATLSPEQVATMTDELSSTAEDYSGIPLHPTDITFPSDLGTLPQSQTQVRILLVGQDRRSGETRQRSDSMILCSIDTKHSQVSLISFLRDTYVPIPGYRPNRLNAAYQWGGFSLLKNTLASNFGVLVDACIEVDFSGFQKIIDTLGGVSISLTDQEAKHLNNRYGWNLSSGSQNLTGAQALAYSRIRAIGNDYGRAQRQRKVLISLIEKIKRSGMADILAVTRQLLPLITTDMTDSQILSYVKDFFPILSECNIRTGQIPAPNTFQEAYVSGMAVLVPDLEANRKVLSQLLAHE